MRLTQRNPEAFEVERVQSNALTIASILKSRRYRTAAFVGGYVLDRQFGLDLGFDLYDSPFDTDRGPAEEKAGCRGGPGL
jgi:hypothetical protein